METSEINKEINKKIDEKCNQISLDLDKLFKSYNTVLRIQFDEKSCLSNNTYPYIEEILKKARFRYEFRCFKNEIITNLILLEKEEIKRNEELSRKYCLLNGYNPEKYYYDVESDVFIKFDEIGANGEEFEEEEEVILRITEKVEKIFSD